MFTAAVEYYAKQVVEALDPRQEHIKLILTREDCHEIDKNIYVKDLRIIANRPPESVFLVDNCAYSYGFQLDQGIPILSYHEGKDDFELRMLEDYLIQLANHINPTAFNRDYFKTFALFQERDFQDAYAIIFDIDS